MTSILANTSLEIWIGLAVLIGGAIGFTAGLLSRQSSKRGQLDEAEQLRRQLSRVETQSGEANRKIARMREELDTVASLAMSLPHVVRDLNRDDIDPADVPKLIFQLAEAIFKPQQLLLYGVGRTETEDKKILRLSDQQGFSPVPDALKTIELGTGKIGWVGKQELDMLEDDWATLSRTERIDVPNNHPEMQPGIIGPLMHHGSGPSKSKVLGVLCVLAPRIRPRDQKLMFQMVTNFGCLALVNSSNLKKLRSLANHDGLTGLYNKGRFKGLAAQKLVEGEKKAQPFALVIFDIDHFKTYNDKNGHPAGDALLQRLAQLIRRSLRPTFIACRYGGEEFVVGLPDTDQQAAYEWAEGLREAIAAEDFEHRQNQPAGFVSISGGVASSPKHAKSVAELIKLADEALYHSKRAGRNRITPYRGVQIGECDEVLVGADATSRPRLPEVSRG